MDLNFGVTSTGTQCTNDYASVTTTTTTTTTTTQTTIILRNSVRDYRVSRYQKKHSPTHHPDHHLIFISFFNLLRSIASSLFKLRAWQSFCTTSLRVIFDLPLGLEPSTSYSIHFFTQSVSSFRNTCPYHCKCPYTIATCFAVVSRLYIINSVQY